MKRYIKYIIIIFIVSSVFLLGYYFYKNNTLKNSEYTRLFVEGDKHLLMSIKNNTIQIYSDNKKLINEMSIVGDEETIISYDVIDLNDDGNDEIIVLTAEKSQVDGKEVKIFSCNSGLKEIYSEDFSSIKPWKVQACDVEGDGVKEISIGVYKKTKFHPIMAKRPFIYSWEGNRLYAKWRGSRLSKPFDDYIFVDIDEDGKDEIVAIELLQNGKKVINTYDWIGFGFEGKVQSEAFDDILSIEKISREANTFEATISNNNKIEEIIMVYDFDNLNIYLEK
ncbi:hypothetical protein [Abyssisolibacter fermentans]|uniref:hypothetical protein n=1 Tax=Abyssisolibacter fermentans TaxID=1766203 RepID=UPI000829BD78|nr:hypothetical protein [Abyssisolibacter fermentans]